MINDSWRARVGKINLDAALEAMEESALIRHLTEEERAYLFKHALTQEATYESLLHKTRREIHRQVAESYERLFAERLDEYVQLLARHYEEADEPEKAVEYLLRAGKRARDFGGLSEARESLERSLALSGDSSPSRCALIHLQLQEVCAMQGDYPRARIHARSALALARAVEDSATSVEALVALAEDALMRGAYSEARPQAEEALEIARTSADQAATARVLRVMGNLARAQGDVATAEKQVEAGLTIARDLGDQGRIADFLLDRGEVAFLQGDFSAASLYAQEALTAEQELGRRTRVARCLNALGEASRYQGDYAQARRYYERSLAVYEEVGSQVNAALVVFNLGRTEEAQGDDSAAARDYRKALTQAVELGKEDFVLGVLSGIASQTAKRGNPRRAAELLGLALHHPASNAYVRADAQPVLAAVRPMLPAEEFDAAIESGKQLNLGNAVNQVLAEP